MTGDAAYVTDVDYASTGEVLQTEAVVGNRKVCPDRPDQHRRPGV
uniref:Uncharacterized protein n=1 Tax=Salinispora arenicola (strain CNS-205) TaxID=391037 RepID=A8M7H7_SALAI